MYEDFNSPGESPNKAPTRRRKRKKRREISTAGIVTLALCCSLVGGTVGVVATHAAIDLRETSAFLSEEYNTADGFPTPVPSDEAEASMAEHTPEPNDMDIVLTGSAGLMTAAEVYTNNVNSTVGVTVSITTNSWGYQSTYPASGSGFILTADGYILTNYHVIEGASEVTVATFDNTIFDAEIVGYDAGNDIAVLKIDAAGLTPVTLGSSDKLRVGDTVVAIGNPLGELTFSLTQGVVSALNREVTLSSNTTMDLIQTDTSINSGNSGGALFNLHGEVVGITNAKYSGGSTASIDNIGFAIPIDNVRGIVESIIQYGYIVKPYIGVSVATVGSEMLSYGFPQGAVVHAVADGSPAAAAGLIVNDIITTINGKPITTSSDLVRVVGRCDPGDVITIIVYRQGDVSTEIAITVDQQQVSALAGNE